MSEVTQFYEEIKEAMANGTQSNEAIKEAIASLKASTRSILELAAEWAIKVQDIDEFEKHFNQLESFYFDINDRLGESENMSLFFGFNLMRLLVQDRVADFHVALERIDTKYHNDVNVALPIRIEQHLMEGTYKKIKQEEEALHDKRFKFLFTKLRSRNRKEILDCLQKSYDTLPVADAKRILLWDNRLNFEKFLNECGLKDCLVGNVLVFKTTKEEASSFPTDEIIENNLLYAQELERIV
ncbi:regulatory particle non-ATPase [Mycoemilia scoparia]|uniref:Regulatory particle non-ATPase n=1 Tax=Mycoemilia scoparia TaxID=417184 RepID=A0A9W8A2Y3_9FUNG|nr:regulatory particle non-ATPase [Mycoemilia scoparia]